MDFGFSNLLGSPYRGGNAAFYGDHVYIGVGNRVSRIHLASTTTCVLKFEAQCDIARVAVRPTDGAVLAVADVLGRLLLVNARQHDAVLHRMALRAGSGDNIEALAFSPDGRYLAVGCGKLVQVWDCDGLRAGKSFAPLRLHACYGSCHDRVTCISWHASGTWLLAGSRDLACHVFSRDKVADYRGATLTGHRDRIVLARFLDAVTDSEGAETSAVTLSTDGKMLTWRFAPDPPAPSPSPSSSFSGEEEAAGAGERGDPSLDLSRGSWRLVSKDFIERQGDKITCCDLHVSPTGSGQGPGGTLVVGFDCGRFDVMQVPGLVPLQSMSVSRDALSTAVFNGGGDLFAVGCAKLGQLLVWDWRSESYVFKQQGHAQAQVTSLDFSRDGALIATGAQDGKVKLWNVRTGQSFVTFAEHKMPVTAVCFVPSNHAVVSSSMDGTVRAYDMIRYRNFRTFQAEEPSQFACVAVDPSGEIVAAGSQDSFRVHLWSMKTGRVLDVFAGHEGPVSGLAFDAHGTTLASSSWDKSVQLWDTFTGKGRKESLLHQHDVLCLAYRPDGKQMCSGALDGTLSFWDTASYALGGTVDGRLDIAGGRLSSDARTLANTSSGKCFTTLCYSAAGDALFAAGASKFVCVYDTAQYALLCRVQISHNLSLDGITNTLNSRFMTEAGAIDPLAEARAIETADGKVGRVTPGGEVLPGTGAQARPAARTRCLRLSPTADAWAAATPEGVLLYAKDAALLFDPFDLAEDVTPAAVHRAMGKREYARALLLSLHLKDANLFRSVVERTPPEEVAGVCAKVPPARLHWMLPQLGHLVAETAHLEFYMIWCEALLVAHGAFLKRGDAPMASAMRALFKAVRLIQQDMQAAVEDNVYKLRYVEQVAKINDK